jgi:hypothetical protein
MQVMVLARPLKNIIYYSLLSVTFDLSYWAYNLLEQTSDFLNDDEVGGTNFASLFSQKSTATKNTQKHCKNAKSLL